MIRILLIEDDNERVRKIKDWLPEDIRLVHAASAGRVIGILRRDGNQYAGIMLDHDLQIQAATSADSELSGTTVVSWIKDWVSTDVPVLVHSMNRHGAAGMMTILQDWGFCVTRISMEDLNRELFMSWLNEVRECWAGRD